MHIAAGRTIEEDCLAVSASDMKEQRKCLRQFLGHANVIKNHRANLDVLVRTVKYKIWFVPREVQRHMVAGSLSTLSDECKSLVLISRLLGGYVCDDQEWLTACKSTYGVTGGLPQPMFRLASAVQVSREVWFDESFPPWAAEEIRQVADSRKNPASNWVFRADRRCIKKDEIAVALFGTNDLVANDAAEKQRIKEQIKKDNEVIKSVATTEGAREAAKKRVSDLTKTSRSFRGTAFTLEGLAVHVGRFL